MKLSYVLLLLVTCFYGSAGQPLHFEHSQSHRIEKIINDRWTFNYFPSTDADKGFESASLNDSSWSAVSIPHTWSTYETTGELHPFIRSASEKDNNYWWKGWGWYRKHFAIAGKLHNRKIFVEFEGVQKYCKVWLNGEYLGDHKGGYGSFDFDISHIVKFDTDNVLAVAVNNSQKDLYSIPPMAAGNFNVYGGIYRDVTITIKDLMYIPMQGAANHEGGTFVTTPLVSNSQGVVNVQTWVKNDNAQTKMCTLRTTIVDAQDVVIQQFQSTHVLQSGELFKFNQASESIVHPHLWSPETPYLYKVYSEILDEANVLDVYESPLGFRWFRWDYAENFLYVNDKKNVIHGGNRHQEFPWLGDALPKWMTLKDFQDISENLNYNFMRTAHYPNDKVVYDLADKYGIVIDEESPSIKPQSFSQEVQEQQMKEMIRRDRNHPSIMFWSMGNETNHAVDSKYAVAEDTTRIITARRVLDGSAGAYVTHTDENLGIESLLRCTIRGWYNTDVKNLEPEDGQHCGTEENQQNKLIDSGRIGTGNLCTFVYADHGCDREYVNEPVLHVNPKGYVDAYRFPKYAYYLWQANYAKAPMIFILPHYWRLQYVGQRKDIRINSNCDTVELRVNGVSRGFQYPDQSNDHSVTFKNILVQPGTLLAIGRSHGTTTTTQATMADVPAKIILKASQAKISAERSSVVTISADIVDAKGVHVYGATNTLKWSVSGPATLVGPSLYESDINKHEQMEGTMYTDAPVMNVIRSTGEPGKIQVAVMSGGLAMGTVEIIADSVQSDNSTLDEPKPMNKFHSQVVKNDQKKLQTTVIPQEIKNTIDEFDLKGKRISDYGKIIQTYVVKNNPHVDTTTVEFQSILKLFVSYLLNNNGLLIADDYNFNVEHFNICMLLSHEIDSITVPESFKRGLKNYYAETFIRQGMVKDLDHEQEWLHNLPLTGTVVISSDADQRVLRGKDLIVTHSNELSELIAHVIPEFSNLSTKIQTDILDRISEMNPYVQKDIHTNHDRKDGEHAKRTTTIHYIVMRDQPIFIPSLHFLGY
jgi:hypothetical protein